LKSEADWQEILKKVKEEEEESSVPTDLFKVKTQYIECNAVNNTIKMLNS